MVTNVLGVKCTQPVQGLGATYTTAGRHALLLLLYVVVAVVAVVVVVVVVAAAAGTATSYTEVEKNAQGLKKVFEGGGLLQVERDLKKKCGVFHVAYSARRGGKQLGLIEPAQRR